MSMRMNCSAHSLPITTEEAFMPHREKPGWTENDQTTES